MRAVICQRPYRIEYCEKWVLEKSWLAPRDSNPDKQIQNLLSYNYRSTGVCTIPLVNNGFD